MDWMTFVVEIIDSLVWPLTILGLFILLREPISDLIPLLAKLRYKDFEVNFAQKLDEASSKASQLPESAERGLPAANGDDELLELAQYSPRAAILEAWIGLENAAKKAADRTEVEVDRSLLRSPLELTDLLKDEGIIDSRQADLMHDLRNLRNAAAHAANFEPSTDEAVKYVRAAARLETSMLNF